MPIPPRRRTTAAIIAGLVALALAACDPADPDPPPPPSISAPTSSSPSPTVSIQERDYAAAAEAFRNANRVIDEALMAGDGDIPEKELAQYAVPDGRYWLTEAQGVRRLAKEHKRYDGLTTVVSVLPIGEYTPNHLSMYACYDGREVATVFEDGRKVKGHLVAGTLTFRKTDGRWRVLGYEQDESGEDINFQPVTKCEDDPQ